MYITIVNVVDNYDDNEFVDVAFFLQLFSLKIVFWVSILTLLQGK